MFWKVPKIWNGERVFVIGGGPSLKNFNFDVLKDKRIIAVNNAYKDVPWADFLIFRDCAWYSWHKDALVTFTGVMVTVCETLQDHKRIKCLKMGARGGISSSPDTLTVGTNSGFCGVSLAIMLGAAEIVLLGFDMKVDRKGDHNYHKDHRRNVPDNIYKMQHLKHFPTLLEPAKQLNIKIYNATPDSELTCFLMVKLGDTV